MKVHFVSADHILDLEAVIWYDPSHLWVGQVRHISTGHDVETEYFGGVGKSSADTYAWRLLQTIGDRIVAEATPEAREEIYAKRQAEARAAFAKL